jgi:hypothetical protein
LGDAARHAADLALDRDQRRPHPLRSASTELPSVDLDSDEVGYSISHLLAGG